MILGLTTNEILQYYGIHNLESQPAGHPSGESAILYRSISAVDRLAWSRKLGLVLIIVSLGAMLSANIITLKLESTYQYRRLVNSVQIRLNLAKPVTPPIDLVKPAFNPLIDPQGNTITPVNTDFSLIIPKVGINTNVVAGVNPASKPGYLEALEKGVAHASTSFYPDEDGTVYLFSHSTNYEWFVKDLNAVFYHLKNLEAGDMAVVMYLGDRYTYQIREKKIVGAREIGYLTPQKGVRTLILQTCWPPGTVAKRMLIFADLVDVQKRGTFEDVIFK